MPKTQTKVKKTKKRVHTLKLTRNLRVVKMSRDGMSLNDIAHTLNTEAGKRVISPQACNLIVQRYKNVDFKFTPDGVLVYYQDDLSD